MLLYRHPALLLILSFRLASADHVCIWQRSRDIQQALIDIGAAMIECEMLQMQSTTPALAAGRCICLTSSSRSDTVCHVRIRVRTYSSPLHQDARAHAPARVAHLSHMPYAMMVSIEPTSPILHMHALHHTYISSIQNILNVMLHPSFDRHVDVCHGPSPPSLCLFLD